ncbi:hypothetical protein ILYODFUR_023775 [Ilyodon furcidens]|uniref:Uncharacterized protein n=1 Tax=Ilyodon furcidens TaxID=33524 RepID=A0ABV0V5J9_9TELE
MPLASSIETTCVLPPSTRSWHKNGIFGHSSYQKQYSLVKLVSYLALTFKHCVYFFQFCLSVKEFDLNCDPQMEGNAQDVQEEPSNNQVLNLSSNGKSKNTRVTV